MQKDSISELKQQARRLRDSMAELGVVDSLSAVSHVTALTLIARTRGFKNWETLEAAYTAPVASVMASPAVQAKMSDRERAYYDPAHPDHLRTHAASFASSCDYSGITSEDLALVVKAVMSPDIAATVLSKSYEEQLRALLEHYLGTAYRGRTLDIRGARERVSRQMEKILPVRRSAKPHAYDRKRRDWWMGQLAQDLKLQGCSESSLEGLVAAVCGSTQSRAVSGKGLVEQLIALFEAYRKSTKGNPMDVRHVVRQNLEAQCPGYRCSVEFSQPPMGTGY